MDGGLKRSDSDFVIAKGRNRRCATGKLLLRYDVATSSTHLDEAMPGHTSLPDKFLVYPNTTST